MFCYALCYCNNIPSILNLTINKRNFQTSTCTYHFFTTCKMWGIEACGGNFLQSRHCRIPITVIWVTAMSHARSSNSLIQGELTCTGGKVKLGGAVPPVPSRLSILQSAHSGPKIIPTALELFPRRTAAWCRCDGPAERICDGASDRWVVVTRVPVDVTGRHVIPYMETIVGSAWGFY